MKIISPKEALQDKYKPFTPKDKDFVKFSEALNEFILKTEDDGNEEPNKNRITRFLESIAYGSGNKYDVIPVDYIDLAIKRDGKPIVLIEVKKPSEKTDMVTQKDFNKKAFHELILYFLREIDPKKGTGNNDITNIIITNNNEWFIIDAQDFRHIADIKDIHDEYKKIDKEKTATYSTTVKFYDAVKKILNKDENRTKLNRLKAVYINFKQDYNKREKISIYKLFTPRHLLKEFGANDSNTLNKKFYNELLHIIGLEEVGKAKKLIQRKPKNSLDSGSLLENTIRKLTTEFSITDEKDLFEKALELNITWLNRLLFLKLLDSHLHSIHGSNYNGFLNTKSIVNYDVLNTLFFEVLAIKTEKREEDIVKQFGNIPYLNSSLFESTKLERDTLRISGLKDDVTMNVLSSTKTQLNKNKPHNTLNYLITFLNSYNFSSDTSKILDDKKGSLINASVLGLIFEKINGYKDGSFFTPSFITMYMTKESIRKSVVAKFNEAHSINAESIEAVKRYLRNANLDLNQSDIKHSNEIVNQITILDPAVGSGHFLVSALNELFVIKSELGLIQGLELYTVTNADDELLIFNTENEKLFEYKVNELDDIPKGKHKIQRIIFQEKQRIIENQLFGVDINPNSVKITRLRLWIELLKNSYYENDELVTLPNIDINIKCGNSLISKFPLNDSDTKNKLFKDKINEYKSLVKNYLSENNKMKKQETDDKIEKLKKGFKKGLHEFSPVMLKFKKALKDYVSTYKYDGLSEELILLAVKSNHGLQAELFDDDKDIKKAKAEMKNKMLHKLNKIYQTIKEFENNEIYENSFEWRFEFPEVLNEDGDFIGFDIVIGNPPYIRHEKIKEYKPYLLENYMVYESTADIYVYFYELSYNLLKENALNSFICSSKFFRARYGEKLKTFILNKTSIEEIVDFNGIKVFEDATVDTAITILRKIIPTKDTVFNVVDINLADSFEMKQKDLITSGFVFITLEELSIKKKIEKVGTPLKEWNVSINRGVLTGYNEAFIVDGKTKKRLIQEDSSSAEILKPILRGKDIYRYYPEFNDMWLVATFPSLNLNIDNYPAIKLYLENFGKKIYQTGEKFIAEDGTNQKSRKKTNNKWFEIQDTIAYYKDFEQELLIWKRIGSILRFSLGKYFCLDSTCILSSEYNKYLLCVFNSKMGHYLMKDSPKTGTGDLLISVQAIEPLKIPMIDNQEPFIEKADAMIELSKIFQTKKTEFLNRITDNLALDKFSKKLEAFYESDFKIFLGELKKKKITLTLSEKGEWEEHFEVCQKDLLKIKEQIDATDKEIDKMVYELYGLSEDEINIVEKSI